MTSNHSIIQTFYTCPGCNIKASNRGNLVRHIREVHPDSASRLLKSAMHMDPKESASVPKELKRPIEATTRDKVPKKSPKKIDSKLSQKSTPVKKPKIEDRIDLTAKDREILREFLILDSEDEEAESPKPSTSDSKPKVKDTGCQTEPMALTIEEILAFCEAVSSGKPDCYAVQAPKVLPAAVMDQNQDHDYYIPKEENSEKFLETDLALSSDEEDDHDNFWLNI